MSKRKPPVSAGTFYEGQDVTITARVTDDAGNVLVPGDIASFTVDVYDITADPRTESPVYEYSSSTSSEILFATLQKGGRWSSDTIGYNLLYRLAKSVIAPFKFQGEHDYRVELWLESEASPSSSENTGSIPVIVELSFKSTLKKG